MYQVIGGVKSRALRVLWMLEELEQPYDHLPAAPHSAEVLAVNPSGKIPALVTQNETLTDSTAIVTYLADAHGALTFPAGTLARARQDALTHAILDEVDGTLWMAARHSFILPEEMRMPAIKDSLKWEFSRALTGLQGRISDRAFVMGDAITVPDLILGHCLRWAGNAGFPVEDNTAMTDYRDRMTARPAFQRAVSRP
jgi:glutathione S-transferase